MPTGPQVRRLVLSSLLAAFAGTSLPEPVRGLIADGLAGVTLFAGNIADRGQLRALTVGLRSVRPDVLIAVDEEGGDVTRLHHATGSRYPGNAALGVVDDPDLTRQVHQAIGAELAEAGVNLNLAPVVDVNTADDNPVIGTRSFGADPTVVAAHAHAAVTGLLAAGVGACAKHFPGHGGTLVDSHWGLPTVDAPLARWRERDLPPFAAAIDAGAPAVMTGHIRVPELTGDDPATFSGAAMALLRDGYGFGGAVVTDALEMAAAAGTAGGVPAAAVRALAAGADLLCLGARVTPELVERVVTEVAAAVADGTVAAGRLEEAAAATATLAARTGTPPAGAPGVRGTGPSRPDLGPDAARRALRIEGDVAGLPGPLVVQLASEPDLARERVPWGLSRRLPDGTVAVVDATATVTELRERARARPVVLVGRHLHRRPDTRALVEALAAVHPCVVVEMGWPTTWRPAGARGFVATYGASDASGAALVDALGWDWRAER